MKKLFVGNLPESVDDERLEELFSELGVVESATVDVDQDTGLSRGHGTVEMATADEAAVVLRSAVGLEVEGRRLRVHPAREEPPSVTVGYVGWDEWDDEEEEGPPPPPKPKDDAAPREKRRHPRREALDDEVEDD